MLSTAMKLAPVSISTSSSAVQLHYIKSHVQKPTNDSFRHERLNDQSSLKSLDLLIDDDSKRQTAIIIASVTCITRISSFLADVLTVAISRIAHDLQLDSNLILWCVSSFHVCQRFHKGLFVRFNRQITYLLRAC